MPERSIEPREILRLIDLLPEWPGGVDVVDPRL
jgi:hypothetical protein